MMEILYEDNHLIIVNKSGSDLVQGDKSGDISLDTRIKEYIKKKYNKPGGCLPWCCSPARPPCYWSCSFRQDQQSSGTP